MKNIAETIMVLLLLANLVILGTSRLKVCIRFFAFEGFLLGLLPVLVDINSLGIRTAILGAGIVALKGIIFPLLLLRTMRSANVYREVEPFIGFIPSMAAGIIIVGLSFMLAKHVPVSESSAPGSIVETGLATVLSGIMLLVSRKKALTQVLGFLILENGIFMLGVAFMRDVSLMVELGVLLDAFAAVFVMSITAHRISREFDHIDTDQLHSLKG